MTLRNHLIVSFDSFIFSFENDHDIHNMKIGRAYDFVNPRPFSSFDYYNDRQKLLLGRTAGLLSKNLKKLKKSKF